MELHARSQTETWYLPRACSLWHEQPHYCEFLTATMSFMHTYVFLVKFLASVEYQRTADRPIVLQGGWRLRENSTQSWVEISSLVPVFKFASIHTGYALAAPLGGKKYTQKHFQNKDTRNMDCITHIWAYKNFVSSGCGCFTSYAGNLPRSSRIAP